MPGCPIACPLCGERYRRDRVYQGGRDITPFNKVMVIHSDWDGRPLPGDSRGRMLHGEGPVFPVWWGESTYARAAA
eukprot:11755823-Alexandrium_andersonii.AAC.1